MKVRRLVDRRAACKLYNEKGLPPILQAAAKYYV